MTVHQPDPPAAMTVPFADLGRLHRSIEAELDDAWRSVLRSGCYIDGPRLREFETAFAAAHGAPRAVGCASGTDALHLALRALGIGRGDEVIVPSMTFAATAEAVVHTGARPVVADVDPDTLLISPRAVEAVRTRATRAVVPVHLYGNVVPFDLMTMWRDEGLLVVEDAAQAHLACDGGVSVGSRAHAACFSFYPAKNLGALGDGGVVLTHDDSLADAICLLRDHGRSSKFVHEAPGWTSRLDELQAALLLAKLPYLREWTEKRRQLAREYDRLLPDDAVVPTREGSVHHQYVVRVGGHRRPSVIARLRAGGVGTGIHYPVTLSQLPWLAGVGSTPNAERAAGEVLSLPMDPRLTMADIGRVAELLIGALHR